jgi:hypothetical protein
MWFCSFQEHLHFWENWITDPVAMQRHNNTDPLSRERVYCPVPRERAVVMLFVSLWVWWLRTVKESSPTSPMWFCSFQEHSHFWKNWITVPVAMQRHNNTDPLPRERVYRPLPRERAVVMLFVSLWVWWLRTVKESSPISPMWFCSFQEHSHFWKYWITAPVAMQRHNNTDPLPWERVYRSVAPGTWRGYVVGRSVRVMAADHKGIITNLPNVVLFVTRPLIFLEKLDYGSCCCAAAQQYRPIAPGTG